jgi:hypothetical protein
MNSLFFNYKSVPSNTFFGIFLEDYLLIIVSAIISYLFFTFIVNRCKLSNNSLVRKSQIILFTITGIVLILLILEALFGSISNYFIVENCPDSTNLETSSVIKDKIKEPSVNVTGSMVLTPESINVIRSGIADFASQIGLGTSIGGVAAAAVKVAGGTPLQKLALVGLGGAIGGSIHVGASAANRALSLSENNNSISSFKVKAATKVEEVTTQTGPMLNDIDTRPMDNLFEGGPASINEASFLASPPFTSTSPFETLLSSMMILNICNIFLIFYLSLSLISKLLLNSNINLTWIDNLIPQGPGFPGQYNEKFKIFIYGLIKYLGKASSLNILIIIILLIISTVGSTYFLSIITNNLETMCEVYLKSKGV